MASRRWFMGHAPLAPLAAKDAVLASPKRVIPEVIELLEGDILTAGHWNSVVKAIQQLQELHRAGGKH